MFIFTYNFVLLFFELTRFIYVPSPHIVEVLSNVLAKCLLNWNIVESYLK